MCRAILLPASKDRFGGSAISNSRRWQKFWECRSRNFIRATSAPPCRNQEADQHGLVRSDILEGMASPKNLPENISFQDRDLDLLRGLFESRVMTAAHIA